MKHIIAILLCSIFTSCENNTSNSKVTTDDYSTDAKILHDSTSATNKRVKQYKATTEFNPNVPPPNMDGSSAKPEKRYKRVTDFDSNVPPPDMYETTPVQRLAPKTDKKSE